LGSKAAVTITPPMRIAKHAPVASCHLVQEPCCFLIIRAHSGSAECGQTHYHRLGHGFFSRLTGHTGRCGGHFKFFRARDCQTAVWF
jgi:hypothetical protein